MSRTKYIVEKTYPIVGVGRSLIERSSGSMFALPGYSESLPDKVEDDKLVLKRTKPVQQKYCSMTDTFGLVKRDEETEI